MNFLDSYLQKIINQGNLQLAASIKKTVCEIVPNYLENFSFCEHKIGLLFGNVQSGKTAQMFGIVSAATDIGFPVFIILTTDNVVLQQQTLNRVRADLEGYCICDEYDTELFSQNNLLIPAIVVLKKNVNTLKQWSNILASTGFMKGNPLFLIDDEADAASLNTLVNKNRKSTINRYLDEIKMRSACSIYLQVTGTPQAILLQTMISGWKPYFIYYFRPGDGYLGGDLFFPPNRIPQCVTFIESLENPLKNALLHHLATSAQMLAASEKVCNFLIHPSVRKAVHNIYRQKVESILQTFRAELESEAFTNELYAVYNCLKPQKNDRISFEVLYNGVKELLTSNQLKVLIMNGTTIVTSNQYEMGCNVIIGGNTLGRGVTFPNLQTIYYARTSKQPQADTMWQHSRMFGYDRDPGMMQLYIDQNLYKHFADINATNNSIISQIEHGLNNIKIFYPSGLNPTRKNVLNQQKVSIISGGTNYYPYAPENDSIEGLDKLLSPFDDTVNYYQASLKLMNEILCHVISADDFRIDAFTSIISSLLAECPTAQGILIIRRNRNVAKGTGALLSANDWKLGASIRDKIVLTVYKMTGEKGWNGREIWVPNIKLPDNVIYYDVNDDNFN